METLACIAMKIRLIAILTILASLSYGQTTADKDILEIIRISIKDGRLPKELINNVDSLYAVRANGKYSIESKKNYPLTIGVEGTKDNGLKHHYHIKWGEKEIWVWGEEDFFAHDIYWLSPSNINIKNKNISFDFATHTWGDKDIRYYKGTIKAEKIGEEWKVTTSTLKKTKNNFDSWEKSVHGNAR